MVRGGPEGSETASRKASSLLVEECVRMNDYEAKETFERIVAQIVKRLDRETMVSADLEPREQAGCGATTSRRGTIACARRQHA